MKRKYIHSRENIYLDIKNLIHRLENIDTWSQSPKDICDIHGVLTQELENINHSLSEYWAE